MSDITIDYIEHWNNKNYVWQQYLAKQLLIPLVKEFSDDNTLYLVSAHFIESYQCIEINGKYCVKLNLNNGEIYYFATIANTYSESLECYKTIGLIGLGKIEISLNEWLEIYPNYKLKFKVIEWIENGKK